MYTVWPGVDDMDLDFYHDILWYCCENNENYDKITIYYLFLCNCITVTVLYSDQSPVNTDNNVKKHNQL